MTSRAAGQGAPLNFEIVGGDASSSYVVHVPHSSTSIPDDVRAQLLLDDVALAEELRRMTDAHTAELARLAAAQVRPRPWLFINGLSRLVVDPERLPEEHEVMSGAGMGAVYTRTSAGLVLRNVDAQARDSLLSRFFTPYAQAMADLVDERISATGRAIVVDLHSYPVKALAYERDRDARRPAVCVGFDFDHTPAALVQRVSSACSVVGDIVVNEPFSGSYIPIRHFGRESKVTSVMLEIRQDVYLREDGKMDPQGASRVNEALVTILRG
jgi:N-formylglutamate deformylase